MSFTVGEALPSGALTVTMGGRPADRCTQAGVAAPYSVTCTRAMIGTEIPEGTEASLADQCAR